MKHPEGRRAGFSTAAVLLGLILLAAVAGPAVSPYDPHTIDLATRLSPPGSAHWLGTDGLGRDYATRLLGGTRVSLAIAAGGVALAGVIGLTLGACAGYWGGWLDRGLLRVSELVMAFPNIIWIMALVSVLGPGIGKLIVIFGIADWPLLHRLVRAQFLSLREQDFVLGLRALGVGDASIVFRHLLRNTVGPITVWTTVTFASVIIGEAGLSFLGLGVQPPTPSLGNLLAQAQDLRIMRDHVWIWLAPGLMLAVISLCNHFLGDRLRDALDTRTAL